MRIMVIDQILVFASVYSVETYIFEFTFSSHKFFSVWPLIYANGLQVVNLWAQVVRWFNWKTFHFRLMSNFFSSFFSEAKLIRNMVDDATKEMNRFNHALPNMIREIGLLTPKLKLWSRVRKCSKPFAYGKCFGQSHTKTCTNSISFEHNFLSPFFFFTYSINKWNYMQHATIK